MFLISMDFSLDALLRFAITHVVGIMILLKGPHFSIKAVSAAIAKRDKLGLLIGPRNVVFSQTTVTEASPNRKVELKYEALTKVANYKNCLILVAGKVELIVLPDSIFECATQKQKLISFIEGKTGLKLCS